ncbi:MAG: hypothetical protein LBG74_00200 [Spirochaetaceae bacterium]|jgi:hypothetical protein|nr:hypothetical protein [Spirochaetaceae bacterium]
MKKLIFFAILTNALALPVFARNVEHNHKPFDMYLGLSLGLAGMYDGEPFEFKKGSAVFTVDFGFMYDIYVASCLSFSAGVFLHNHTSLYVKDDLSKISITDIPSLVQMLQSPMCITVPLMAHLNIPPIEWLYVGAGFSINVPFYDMLQAEFKKNQLYKDFLAFESISMFMAVPIHIGFEFFKPDSNISRFYFTITPTFIPKQKTFLPVGIVYQRNVKIGR